ncbi:MAG: MMPL family transporter, partial [Pirellulales bacterium]|nr:MMPL family transporter [Pirellulales bacterium]
RCLHLAHWFVAQRRIALVIAALLLAVSITGLWEIKTETSFLRNFRSGSSVVAAYQDVEQNFGGAGVWDIVLDAPDQIDTDYLELIRRLEDDLRKIRVDGKQLTKVLSLADADAVAARAPLLRLATPSIRLAAMRLKMPVFFDALLTKRPVNRKLRIMLRSQEHLDADQKSRFIARVEQTVAQHTTTPAFRSAVGRDNPGRVTGYYVLMARLVSHLVGDQWRCFLASGLLVWVLLTMATRSLRLACAAMLPNLLPVFVVLACAGVLGGKINMGAAMIAAVSIGLSIDGSVHLLAGYRRHRRRGHQPGSSSVHAAGNIGVPVLLATIALVVGFSVLASSEFIPTATFGLLVAATLSSATIINLTLLPALVAWIERSPSTETD